MAEPLEQIERGWPAIKSAPFHFAGAVLALVAIGWLAIYFLFAKITEGKDATIQAKEAIIASKESTIDAKQKALEVIQQTVSAKDDLIISLTNQFYRILAFQDQLSSAQTNLLKQQEQLDTVEYWMRNIYDNVTNDTISATDPDRVVCMPMRNGEMRFLLRLSRVPVPGSLQVLIRPGKPLDIPQATDMVNSYQNTFKNCFSMSLWRYDTNALRFSCRYVIDTRQTNYFSERMPVLNRDFVFEDDGSVSFSLSH